MLPIFLAFLPIVSGFTTPGFQRNAGFGPPAGFGGQHSGHPGMQTPQQRCQPVSSQNCDKYHFNQTADPFENYLGHTSVAEADSVISWLFGQITNCSIPRVQAETLACAIYIPLCMPEGLLPPCAEDCKEMISICRVNEITGYEEALAVCTIFPSRSAGRCLSTLS